MPAQQRDSCQMICQALHYLPAAFGECTPILLAAVCLLPNLDSIRLKGKVALIIPCPIRRSHSHMG